MAVNVIRDAILIPRKLLLEPLDNSVHNITRPRHRPVLHQAPLRIEAVAQSPGQVAVDPQWIDSMLYAIEPKYLGREHAVEGLSGTKIWAPMKRTDLAGRLSQVPGHRLVTLGGGSAGLGRLLFGDGGGCFGGVLPLFCAFSVALALPSHALFSR